MVYAYTQDVPIDTEMYARITELMGAEPMDGLLQKTNTGLCVAACLAQPAWKLSVQTHKTTGIR